MYTVGIIEFAAWLRQELERRGMNQADLSRLSGISTSQVSKILSTQSTPSEDSYLAIAHALKLQPDIVFRAAGLFPPDFEGDPLAKETAYLVTLLPDDKKQMAVDYVRFLVQTTFTKNRSK